MLQPDLRTARHQMETMQMKRRPGTHASRRRSIAGFAAILGGACILAGLQALPARAAGNADAAAASSALFADMSRRDLPGVLRYIPAEGFTEISPDSNGVQRLDAAAFAGLFKSAMVIDLHMTGMQVQTAGNAAVVTGIRVGAISALGSTPVEGRQLATLIWSKAGTQWQLQHIHLSVLSSEK